MIYICPENRNNSVALLQRTMTKILVVCDRQSILGQVRTMLTDCLGGCYKIITATSVGYGLDAITDERPEVMLTEYDFLDGSGRDLIENAKTLVPNGVRILLVEANCRKMAQTLKTLGTISAFLVRPITATGLTDVLNETGVALS